MFRYNRNAPNRARVAAAAHVFLAMLMLAPCVAAAADDEARKPPLVGGLYALGPADQLSTAPPAPVEPAPPWHSRLLWAGVGVVGTVLAVTAIKAMSDRLRVRRTRDDDADRKWIWVLAVRVAFFTVALRLSWTRHCRTRTSQSRDACPLV